MFLKIEPIFCIRVMLAFFSCPVDTIENLKTTYETQLSEFTEKIRVQDKVLGALHKRRERRRSKKAKADSDKAHQ